MKKSIESKEEILAFKDDKTIVSQTRKLKGNKGYGGDDDTLIHLDDSATILDIGNAVIKSFREKERIYSK